MRKISSRARVAICAAAIAAFSVTTLMPTPASARWYHPGWGWHAGWHYGWRGCCWGPGLVVGIANNLVNNLPLGLIAGGTLQAEHARGLIANAVLIGVDLGPNLSVTGSLATILWLIALRKEKLDVSGWDFLKVVAIAMPLALLASIGGAILTQTLITRF